MLSCLSSLGESGNEIAARLKRDLIPTLLNGLMFWPLCDFFTYKIIPVHLQVLSMFDFLEFDDSCYYKWLQAVLRYI